MQVLNYQDSYLGPEAIPIIQFTKNESYNDILNIPLLQGHKYPGNQNPWNIFISILVLQGLH